MGVSCAENRRTDKRTSKANFRLGSGHGLDALLRPLCCLGASGGVYMCRYAIHVGLLFGEITCTGRIRATTDWIG